MKRNAWTDFGVFIVLIAIGVVTRLAADRLWRMEGVAAWYCLASVCGPTLFAGFYLSRKWLAIAVPLAAMFLSDLGLPEYSYSVMTVVVYAAFAAPVALGWVLRGRLSPLRFFGAAAGSTLFYFVATNFAHWVLAYPTHSMTTLNECFALALPFYKYKFVGDLCWSGVLFGAYALATQRGWLPAVTSTVTPTTAAPLEASR